MDTRLRRYYKNPQQESKQIQQTLTTKDEPRPTDSSSESRHNGMYFIPEENNKLKEESKKTDNKDILKKKEKATAEFRKNNYSEAYKL